MADFKIILDSSCDLSLETLQKLDIDLVPLLISFDGVNYQKELIELTKDRFYEILSTQDVFPKTTLPPIQDYIDIFKKNIELGNNRIICVCLSSHLSGTYQAAIAAKSVVVDEFPDCKISILDSVNATSGFSLLVYELVRMRDDGVTLEATASKMEKIKALSKTSFSVDSLEYLFKGGRIGRVAAFAGGLLNIKPVLKMEVGQLSPTGKVRGKKKAMSEIMDFVLKETKEYKDDFIYACVYGTEREDAITIQRTLENEHGYTFLLEPVQVGMAIGSHTGPTSLGISFFPKYDRFPKE